MLEAAKITTAKQLETAIGLAGHDENRGVRAMLEIRARQLNREDLIPRSWSAPKPASRPAPTPVKPAQTRLLDEPPAALMERHADLDRVVRALAREQNVDYATALDSVVRQTLRGRELMRATPMTMADVLRGCGVKNLDRFRDDVKMLEQRDDQVVKTLDTAAARIPAETVDAQGRVALAPEVDRYDAIHDPKVKTGRLERIRQVAPEYQGNAGAQRFADDDRLHIESGVDLVRTRERPKELAAARQKAVDAAMMLDGIIEAGREPARRTVELDNAIAKLTAERSRIAPRAPGSQPVVDPSPVRDSVQFVDLSASQMTLALERYGRGDISLDDAAAEVAGGIPTAGNPQTADFGPRNRTPGISDSQQGRQELHERVVQYQRERGIDYLAALEAVTRAGPGVVYPHWKAVDPSGR